MSFILDALKKSENERQRQSGPALFEVKVARPKSGLPVWAIALAALLVVNLGIVAWLLLRSPSRSEALASQTAVAAPMAQHSPATGVAPAPELLSGTGPTAVPPAATVPSPSGAASPPAPDETANADPMLAGQAGGEVLNPDDFEPATYPSAAPTSEPHVTRGTVEGLPRYDEAAGMPGAGLPNLRLDLHVYAARPQDRFVMINMHRLREGEATPEGVRVETITPDGAVLSFRGSRFVLDRD